MDTKRVAFLTALEQGGLIGDPRFAPGDADFLLVSCPFAHWNHAKGCDRHPSMSIRIGNTDDGWFSCFACKEQGPLWEMFYFIGNLTNRQDWIGIADDLLDADFNSAGNRLKAAAESYEPLTPPVAPDMRALEKWFGERPEDPKIAEYLRHRGIMPEMAIPTFVLAWDEFDERVLFPMFDAQGGFVGLTGRAVNDHAKLVYKNYWGSKTNQYLGRPLIGDAVSLYEPTTETYVLLVEGQYDLMATYENLLMSELLDTFYPVCSFNAECGPGQLAQLESMGKGILCLYDDDEAGDIGWANLMKHLDNKVPVLDRLTPPEKRDPGQMTTHELTEVLQDYI